MRRDVWVCPCGTWTLETADGEDPAVVELILGEHVVECALAQAALILNAAADVDEPT